MKKILLLILILSNEVDACSWIDRYLYNNFEKLFTESKMVLLGEIEEVIFNDSESEDNRIIERKGVAEIDGKPMDIPFYRPNEDKSLSKLIRVKTLKNYKGTRKEYYIEVSTLCASSPYKKGEQYVFFLNKEPGAIIYRNEISEVPTEELNKLLNGKIKNP